MTFWFLDILTSSRKRGLFGLRPERAGAFGSSKMNLGFVSAIFPEWTLEQVVTFAGEAGFSSVEVMCWPPGKAERRYAGVSHLDVDDVGPAAIDAATVAIAASGTVSSTTSARSKRRSSLRPSGPTTSTRAVVSAAASAEPSRPPPTIATRRDGLAIDAVVRIDDMMREG